MMDWGDGGWFGMGWMVIVVFIPILLVLGLGVWAVVGLTRPASTGASTPLPENSRQILDRRLAAGEIDEQQYVQLMRLIAGAASPPGVK
ncbi:MAG: hypothetical protein QG597_2421 [Actinomycetota bacterium]|nr:hypothetical protein [Actinomycetota bacterium]